MSKKYDVIQACIANVQYAIISSSFFVMNSYSNSKYIVRAISFYISVGFIFQANIEKPCFIHSYQPYV